MELHDPFPANPWPLWPPFRRERFRAVIPATVPLIAVTGMGGPKDHEAAKLAGFLLVAVKPCPPADLLPKVELAIAMDPPKLPSNGN